MYRPVNAAKIGAMSASRARASRASAAIWHPQSVWITIPITNQTMHPWLGKVIAPFDRQRLWLIHAAGVVKKTVLKKRAASPVVVVTSTIKKPRQSAAPAELPASLAGSASRAVAGPSTAPSFDAVFGSNGLTPEWLARRATLKDAVAEMMRPLFPQGRDNILNWLEVGDAIGRALDAAINPAPQADDDLTGEELEVPEEEEEVITVNKGKGRARE